MSFLSTYDLLRQLLGLPPKEPSRISIDRGENGVYEFYGWKIAKKVWRDRNQKIIGIIYKTDRKKVIMEFKIFNRSKDIIVHTARQYENVPDAIKAMKAMQG
jgi:hypothetical protein